ncbi:N-acetylmuramoyl-L-alanine amidase [Streptococcus sp. 263_SSPC]|uniref:N-acetylmuramoyl-L-alanine amidase n=1 Tax=Streptococcus sp. 263_SSPC TaxID=1579343 RepID=UPI00065FCDCC|nr:N-acetylmuramoyl-L-alanine amidase [Streptococcus sp. 263_SSPC]
MDSLLKFFKKKNIQQLLGFLVSLLLLWIIAYPLVSESSTVKPQTNTQQANTDTNSSNTATQTSTTVHNKIVQFAVNTSDTPLKVYHTMDAKGIPIGEITKNQYLLALQKLDNGWIQVQYDEQVAYIEDKNVLLTTMMKGYTSGGLKLRETQDENSKVLLTIPNGELFYLIEEVNDKNLKVRYLDKEGYVDSDSTNYAIDLIQETLNKQAGLPTTIDSNKMFVTKLKETPIYSTSNVTSELIGTVDKGTQFAYEDRDGDFYKIPIGNGKFGYIPYWLVTTNFSAIETDETIPQGIKNAIIVIDPGHGGDDPGAVVNFSDKHEADHTLTTALLVKKELEAMGAKVFLTRTNDSSVSLSERADISNKNNADAFISIHFDSAEDSSLSGTTTYYFSEKSENLSQTVNKYLARNLPLKNQGSRFQNFMVLRDNARPSILLELGYLNNQGDNKVISSEEYQQNIAKSIANALKEYFQ